jgi:hypothetical protein
MSAVEWAEANQRVLVAELARLKGQIAGEDAETGPELAQAHAALPAPAAIDVISEGFGLTSFERDILP